MVEAATMREFLPFQSGTDLPFPAGSSPFRIKGNAYINNRLFAAMRVPGGIDGVVAALRHPELQAFYSQRFLAGSWYDYFPLLLITRVEVMLMSRPWPDVLHIMGESLADRDLGGIYKLLLKFTSPKEAMLRMPKVHPQYFNFGRVEIMASGDTFTETCIHGVPQIVAAFFQTLTTHFVHRLIGLAGGKDVEGIWHPHVPDGTQAGLSLVKISARTVWTL